MRYNHRDDIVISFPSANRRLVIVEVFLDVTSSGGSSIDRSITNHGNMNSQGLLIFCDRVHSNGCSWLDIEIVLIYQAYSEDWYKVFIGDGNYVRRFGWEFTWIRGDRVWKFARTEFRSSLIRDTFRGLDIFDIQLNFYFNLLGCEWFYLKISASIEFKMSFNWNASRWLFFDIDEICISFFEWDLNACWTRFHLDILWISNNKNYESNDYTSMIILSSYLTKLA